MSTASILARLERIERKLNLDRTVGQWVRGLNGTVIWDPTDLDAPPESDPLPRILEQLDRSRERLQAEPGWKPPTPEQLDDARRAFEDVTESMRAERRAIRDFSDAYERERAAKVT
jgi:hypothetical protein